jgi:hypothetical protein
MTIEEYKEKLVSIVKDMETEHGCRINRVCISGYPRTVCEIEKREYNIEIEM